AAGVPIISVAAHPGIASTGLFAASVRRAGHNYAAAALKLLARPFMQSAKAGAWPTLYAAADAGLSGGEYIGPRGPSELWGKPRIVKLPRSGADAETASRLWAVSTELTGVTFEELAD